MRQGFTLVELLIVMAILAATMAIIVPSFNMVSSAQVSVAAKDTLRLMRYARNMALQTQQPIRIAFAPDSITVSAETDSTGLAQTAPQDEDPRSMPTITPRPRRDRTEPDAAPAGKKATPHYAVAANGVDTIGLSKNYRGVAFAFDGFDDSLAGGRKADGSRVSGFRRSSEKEREETRLKEEDLRKQESFTITVRANGTVRPFTMRVYERDSDKTGDVLTFDFLCSGKIGDGDE